LSTAQILATEVGPRHVASMPRRLALARSRFAAPVVASLPCCLVAFGCGRRPRQAYILRCADCWYYYGSTSGLLQRLGRHHGGRDGTPPPMELVRLAIPRRVYTQSHLDYVVEAIVEVFEQRSKLRPLEIVAEPPSLRHFTARFREL
jgi:hypothetical protein